MSAYSARDQYTKLLSLHVIHFVCKCNLYNDLRKTMYRTVEHKHTDFYMYDNKNKFIFLVQKEWKILGKNLVEAWSECTHKLYI